MFLNQPNEILGRFIGVNFTLDGTTTMRTIAQSRSAVAAVIVGLALAISTPAFAQQQQEVDALLKKVKPRAEVFDAGSDIALQFSLPPQYAQCLHVSFVEANDKNPVAHRYLLEQVDFLNASGLSSANIKALLSYGHALSNLSYASQAGRPLDKLDASDLPKLQKYSYQTFARLACVQVFSDDRLHEALRNLIRASQGKK
ncbi:hypothetical protein SCD_n01956 [Sulfuricella denitrificans skB26]|uniref:Uncharacterized protein n=1 Tax=Sulfuricella denitrificans (strain DSM 22764 / NBRC 105220 / skB26) TaxID=1163617 RepID=S6B5F4_SULDS|nr:hypothetical protein [Sulfuricella denitrificans]BAN35767.1 hypothetical protein SCD_n01956 [Sulfuricella denitrificans skB26]